LNACASALVPALSLSAPSSLVAECEPRPKVISSQVTSTLATIFWSRLRSKWALVWIAYLRVCRKQRVQAVRVGPPIGVGEHVAAQFAVLGGIRYSPIDRPGLKGNLQGGTEVLDPLS